MEIQDLKKREARSVPLSIRTTKAKSLWMKKHNVSPSALFNAALEELMAEHK